MQVLDYLLALVAFDQDHRFGEFVVYLLGGDALDGEVDLVQFDLEVGLGPVLFSLHLG